VGCLVLARRNETARPLALALACGAAYAVTDFSIKLATGEFSGGLSDLFTHWPIYAIAVVGPIGFVLNQNAFQAGALPPVLAIITITDTIGAIGLGWLFLNEKLSSGPAEIAGQAASLVVMTVGIVVLAHRSPQAAARQAQAAQPAGPADAQPAGPARPAGPPDAQPARPARPTRPAGPADAQPAGPADAQPARPADGEHGTQ
jgi:hypothetical protein